LEWDRKARIADVRDRIWLYVSPASRFEPSAVLVAAALLKLPETDLRRLGELQFVLSEEVGQFLSAMPRLVRQLATSSTREEQWTIERLHGPILWSRTLALRSAIGSQLLFVTSPAERDYQTPENELLVYVLDAIAAAAKSSGWTDSRTHGAAADVVRERLSKALRWQQSRMLLAIDRLRPTPRTVARIRSSRRCRHYAPVLSAYRKLVALVERTDPELIRKAVEHTRIVTADEATLFELLTTFRLCDALNTQGWNLHPFRLFGGQVTTYGIRSDGRRLDLWYQCTPASLGTGSRYRQVLAAHTFPRTRDLRPDMVLNWKDPEGHDRRLLIECKLSRSMGVGHAARQALADLLSYRRAFDTALANTSGPYGLGVAWGEDLHPTHNAEVVLCTPDTIGEAISQIVILRIPLSASGGGVEREP
jgi:hypothetical protein